MQAVTPFALEYVFGTYVVHVVATVPAFVPTDCANVPDVQAVHAVAPVVEVVPGGHPWHLTLPVEDLKKPGEHFKQDPQYPSGPVLPAAHVRQGIQTSYEELPVRHVL